MITPTPRSIAASAARAIVTVVRTGRACDQLHRRPRAAHRDPYRLTAAVLANRDTVFRNPPTGDHPKSPNKARVRTVKAAQAPPGQKPPAY
jgi:hypothetical protein